MGGRTKIQPVSRMGLAPLVEMAEQLLAMVPGWQDTAPPDGMRRPPSDLERDLQHLAERDLDGTLAASVGDDVVAFGVGFVRSRHLFLPHLWVLPEYEDHGAVHSLLRRLILFGERAAVQDVVASVAGGPPRQALAYRFGLRPRFPVYRLVLGRAGAAGLGAVLAASLPGAEITSDAVSRRAWTGDPERLDRLARGVIRPIDHEYWAAVRGLRLAMVRDGKRVAGYAYADAGRAGPVAASTPEAARAALGWSLSMAANEGVEQVEALVPAVFEAGVEAMLDAGARCVAALEWMSLNAASGLDRCVLSGITLL
jgi:hypothetical protein